METRSTGLRKEKVNIIDKHMSRILTVVQLNVPSQGIIQYDVGIHSLRAGGTLAFKKLRYKSSIITASQKAKEYGQSRRK